MNCNWCEEKILNKDYVWQGIVFCSEKCMDEARINN
jgi:hypothetical protein